MSLRRLRAILLRVIQETRRDRPSLALLFVAPLVITGLVTFIVRQSETPTVSAAVVSAGGAAGDAVATTLEGALTSAGVTVAAAADADAARSAVEAGDVDVAILLPADIATGGATITVLTNGLDPAGEAAQLRVVAGAISTAAGGAGAGRLPTIEHATVYGTVSSDPIASFAPAIVGFFVYFFVYILTGVSFLRERTGGTLERLMATPVTKGEVVAGYTIGFCVFATIQVAILMTWALGTLHVPAIGPLPAFDIGLGIQVAGGPLVAYLVVLALAVGAVSLGIFLSTFARTELQVIQFIPIVLVPQFLLSGVLFPVSTLPSILQPFVKLMPLAYAVDGLRQVFIRGADLSVRALQVDLLVLVGAASPVRGARLGHDPPGRRLADRRDPLEAPGLDVDGDRLGRPIDRHRHPLGELGALGSSGRDHRGDRLDHPDLGRQVGVVEQAACQRGPGLAVRLEQAEQFGEPHRAILAVGDDRGQPDGVDARIGEGRDVPARRVVEVRPPAGHPGPEVRADRPEDHHGPAGHVLAAVRADPLDDRLGAGVADGEAHPGPTDQVQPAAGRAVQDRVAGDGLRSPASRRGPAPARSSPSRRRGPCRRSRWPGRRAGARRPGRRTPRTTGRRRRAASRWIGPCSSPRSRAPVSAAPNERSAVVTRRPAAVTEPWPRNAAAMAASMRDAWAWRMSRPAPAGSARRAGARAPRRGADHRAPARPAPPGPRRAAAGSRRRSRPRTGHRPPPARGGRPRRSSVK